MTASDVTAHRKIQKTLLTEGKKCKFEKSTALYVGDGDSLCCQ